jgi:lipopolysaccharide transport system ATP-binding protein
MSVIRVENLGKCYPLKHQGQGPRSGDGLRHALQDAITAPFRRLRRSSFDPNNPKPTTNNSPEREDFWALRDVSFEVNEGEVVGIIGRNGAGKSTLLKILSRITEPTTGRIGIKGRVASLLEVGTGFHPELTGQENIYLNGAILGMSRAEVKRKFDEIVDFSGVGKFLNTPVKRYSSGMYVRLAFAVAAHLEPEILIIDEVLAVGDAEFQKKCLGKMRDVASAGRTVLFVSHNMAAVSSLCTGAILLERGTVAFAGDAEGGISAYRRHGSAEVDQWAWQSGPGREIGNERIALRAVAVEPVDPMHDRQSTSTPLNVIIDYEVLLPVHGLTPFIFLLDDLGTEILNSVNLPSAVVTPDRFLEGELRPGSYRSACTIPGDLLNEREYGIKVGFNTAGTHFEFVSSEIVKLIFAPTQAMRAEYSGRWPGLIRPRLAWSTSAADVRSGLVANEEILIDVA